VKLSMAGREGKRAAGLVSSWKMRGRRPWRRRRGSFAGRPAPTRRGRQAQLGSGSDGVGSSGEERGTHESTAAVWLRRSDGRCEVEVRYKRRDLRLGREGGARAGRLAALVRTTRSRGQEERSREGGAKQKLTSSQEGSGVGRRSHLPLLGYSTRWTGGAKTNARLRVSLSRQQAGRSQTNTSKYRERLGLRRRHDSNQDRGARLLCVVVVVVAQQIRATVVDAVTEQRRLSTGTPPSKSKRDRPHCQTVSSPAASVDGRLWLARLEKRAACGPSHRRRRTLDDGPR
jgi:hypothetical protein